MSDTPTPPAGDADGGAAGGGPEGAGDETPWYSKPTTWVALVLLLAALVVVFLLANDDDSGSNNIATPSSSSTTSSTTSSTPSSSTTSTSVPEGTTTTTAGDTEGTDTGETPGVTPVAISESAVKGTLAYYDGSEGQVPFDDGGVEANWYTWDGRFVVVYAGWDHTAGDPQCPGNSLESGGAFEFISNSPSGDGGCDPEDAFPNLVTGDEGARVCEGLVLYRTIIPVEGDDGTPTAGNLYGSIERAVDDGYVGATSMAAIDSGTIGELDVTADAYTVPDGWLDGTTEVTC